MLTTLWEKVFIDGFHKASSIVATLRLAELPDEGALRDAMVETIERHPRLRSRVRNVLGVPAMLVPGTARAWMDGGGLRVVGAADLRALEEDLLSTPLDLTRAPAAEALLVREPAALVLKVHHAVLDATSGFALLHDFARIHAGLAPREPTRRPAQPRMQRARLWVTQAQLRPRVPEISVTADYHPAADLEAEPVVYTRRRLRGAHPRIAERARALGATFSELVASAVFSAMHAYNVATGGGAAPPQALGLMFARAQLRGPRDAAFRADTRVLSLPAAHLVEPHQASTLAAIRRAASDPRHDDLALALLYATRKIRGRERAPSPQRSLHVTLSDLTAFGRGIGGRLGALAVTDLDVLASPTSFDHAGILVTRTGDDVVISVIAHRGALAADALLEPLCASLGEDTTTGGAR